jgi:hypothetical protein
MEIRRTRMSQFVENIERAPEADFVAIHIAEGSPVFLELLLC